MKLTLNMVGLFSSFLGKPRFFYPFPSLKRYVKLLGAQQVLQYLTIASIVHLGLGSLMIVGRRLPR